MRRIAKLLVVSNFILILGMIQNISAEQTSDSVAGVLVFSSSVSVEKAAEIGKMLGNEDSNFVHLTSFGWAPEKNESGGNASALMFNYMKKNDKFIEGKKLGQAMKKKIEAKYGDIVRSWHISEGAVEVK